MELEEPWIEGLPVLPTAETAGADLTATVKRHVIEVKEALAKRHRAGASGGAIVAAYTESIDRVMRFLFDVATAEYSSRYVLLDRSCTVAAQGGYGRAELNPESDIDLLVLFPWRINAYVETVAERLLYTLWDTGVVQVGHASRTIADCARLAQKDFKVKTSLLDARYVAGDRELYGQFETTMENEVLKKGAARFYREKLAESRERHRKYGDSVYLLEPHLKDGPGGLRDIHTAMWLAKVKYKVRGLRDLVVKGVISERECAEIEASRDFLFRVRNALHFLAGAYQDLLSFDFQDRIAAELGFGAAGTRPALEAFMRAYYGHATTVLRFSDGVVERCLEQPHPYRMIGQVAGREIREGVWILNGTLSVNGPEAIRRDPTNLVTLFRDAQRHGVELARGTKRLVQENLHLIGEEERRSPAFTQPFLSIVGWKHDVWETLREMHALGVLREIFPEFGRIDRLVQRELYHVYTVDEHSLAGIRELERLRRGEYKESAGLLTEVMRDIDRHEVLFLAMLFHDIGKGYGEAHSERGAALVRTVAGRLAMNEDDAAQWELLVREHLLMSHLAEHRDTHDPSLIVEFARKIRSVENLKLLYVMTFADMRAVGPKLWNNWRDMLLGELYMRALTLFEQGQLVLEDPGKHAARVAHRLLAGVDAARRPFFEAFLASMPERYLTTTPEAQIPAHFEIMNQLRGEWSIRPAEEHRHAFASNVRHVTEYEYSEFTICMPDRPGLFAMITGVLTAEGMNIVGARIATSQGGIAVDSFRVAHLEQREIVLDAERWERVNDSLAKVLHGQLDVEALVAASRRPSILERKKRPDVSSEVIADNSISQDYTVLDVITRDRVGVLFAITHCLHRLGIVIHLAKITTQAHQVFDVFYVTDDNGEKVTEPARLQRVRETIVEQLGRLEEPRATAETG